MKTELITQYAEVYNADGYPPIAGKILGLFYVSDEALSFIEEKIAIHLKKNIEKFNQ